MKAAFTVVYVILLTAVELIAQTTLNRFHLLKTSKEKERLWFLPYLASLLYATIAFILLQSYQYSKMAHVEVYWDAATTIIVPLFGMILFYSHINFYGWIGITMTIIGALLLAFSTDLE
jgi:multidrug transporter EmrE-like cation transporter